MCESDITSFVKVNKPVVVYIFDKVLGNDLHSNIMYIWQNLGIITPKCDFQVIMPPTLKKLKGHIALGLSVHLSVRPSVR